MRIGDWSSDVCSSDLTRCHRLMRPIHLVHLDKTRSALVLTRDLARGAMNNVTVAPITSTVKGLSTEVAIGSQQGEIGRASCRESVWQYVSISVVAVSLKKKNKL